jgi:ACR3 family arsenite efflux pump ArsB
MRERSDLERLRDHLDKFLGMYVGLMIVIGIVTGYYVMGWVRLHAGALNDLMMASIYIMIFPMMVMLNVRGLAGAFRNWKVVSAVVLLNFAYGPLMAIALGQAFVGSPFVRLGLFVAWLVPCSSMSIGYVGLMRGDINSATSMVALSFILSLALIPVEAGLYMSTFARGIALSGAALSAVETSLVMTIIEVLLIPLVVAIPRARRWSG